MNRLSFNRVEAMTNDDLRRVAPSIFATAPSDKVSDKYAFIPTTRVLETLQKEGWTPVNANQAKCKTVEGRDFVKHVIRFRKADMLDAQINGFSDSVPELVLTNAHNGSAAFNFMLGIYRLVCANGLIVGDTFMKQSVRHIGYTDHQVLDASYKIIAEAPKAAELVQSFQSVSLNQDERLVLAKSALQIKYADDKAPIEPVKLLTPRRFGDEKTDLWTTFNTIQENMIRGGLRGVSRNVNPERPWERPRRIRTREVKSVSEDIRINKALWTLAEEMKKLKMGQTA